MTGMIPDACHTQSIPNALSRHKTAYQVMLKIPSYMRDLACPGGMGSSIRYYSMKACWTGKKRGTDRG